MFVIRERIYDHPVYCDVKHMFQHDLPIMHSLYETVQKWRVIQSLWVGPSESAFVSVPLVSHAVTIHYRHQRAAHRLLIVFGSN